MFRWPGFVDFEDPFRSCGLENTRNLYLEINQFIRVGVWHILPSSYQAVVETHLEFEKNLLEDEKTVFLYLHGNSANRAGAHRVELYKVGNFQFSLPLNVRNFIIHKYKYILQVINICN